MYIYGRDNLVEIPQGLLAHVKKHLLLFYLLLTLPDLTKGGRVIRPNPDDRINKNSTTVKLLPYDQTVLRNITILPNLYYINNMESINVHH